MLRLHIPFTVQLTNRLKKVNMARLSDSVENERKYLEGLECPTFAQTAFTPPRALSDCKVALISTAGLMQRGDVNVPAGTGGYRIIDSTVADADILINHVSINFDRTAFAEDVNSVFPRQRLAALEQQQIIAHAATEHYSFMGATAPEKMEEQVHALATDLKSKNINTVCLLPV
jgi:D-proline reductase (dithiol) PrdB